MPPRPPAADDLPPYEPLDTESVLDIPERFLAAGFLTLRDNGEWLYKGAPIANVKMQRFLSRRLMRNREGGYWVVNGPQRAEVRVEDTPFFITGIEVADGRLTARLSSGDREPLALDDLTVSGEGILYTQVRRGQAGAAPGEPHAARFLRAAQAQMSDYLVETDSGFAVDFDGRRYPIPARTPEPTNDRRPDRGG